MMQIFFQSSLSLTEGLANTRVELGTVCIEETCDGTGGSEVYFHTIYHGTSHC